MQVVGKKQTNKKDFPHKESTILTVCLAVTILTWTALLWFPTKNKKTKSGIT